MTEIVIPPRRKGEPLRGDAGSGGAKWPAPSPLAWTASRLIVLLLLAGCFLSAARVSKTYFGVYPVTPTLMVSPEAERWALSSYPVVRLARYINLSVPDDARIMVFRQSDIAYYTDNPIVTFTSDEQATLFEPQTPQALHSALLARGIDYVAVPAYDMAEVNRSAFKPLLNEGHYAVLVFETGGEKLYRIYAQRQDLTPVDSVADRADDAPPNADGLTFVRVREANFSAPPEIDRWTAFLRPTSLIKAVMFGQPELIKPVPGRRNGGIRMVRDRPWVARKALVDILQAWPLQMQYSPIVRADTEFPVRNGVYRFSGQVEAKGKAALHLRITVMNDDQTQRSYQWQVWSEVLDGEATRLQAMTAIAIPQLAAQRDVTGSVSAAMLFFTLEQGGYLGVSELAVDRLETPEGDNGFFALLERRSAAHAAGWSLEKPDYGGEYDRPLDMLQREEAGGLAFKQISGAAETLISPPFIVSAAQTTVLEDVALERKAQQSMPRVDLGFDAQGRGALNVRVFGHCTDGSPFSHDLRTYSLGASTRRYVPSGELSCVPSLIRTAFTLDRDRFLSPPNFERGEAVVSDLSVRVGLWANDGQQRDVILRAAPELAPRSHYITPDETPDRVRPNLILPDFDL